MAIKGYQGAVDGASDVRIWQLAHEAESLPVADSATKGAYNELAGVEKWHGWYGAYGHTPASYPNDALSFEGNIDTDLDKGVSGTAKVEAVQIFWDWARGMPIYHTVRFKGNGALTFGAATAADAGPPDWDMTPDVTGLHIAAPAAEPSYSAFAACPVRANLLIWSALAGFTDAQSSNREDQASGNLHWAFTVDLHTSDPSALHSTVDTDINDAIDIKAYVDASLFWLIQWARIKTLGPLVVDIEGEQLVATRIRAMGAGWVDYNDDGTWEGGSLTDPSDTAVWTSS